MLRARIRFFTRHGCLYSTPVAFKRQIFNKTDGNKRAKHNYEQQINKKINKFLNNPKESANNFYVLIYFCSTFPPAFQKLKD